MRLWKIFFLRYVFNIMLVYGFQQSKKKIPTLSVMGYFTSFTINMNTDMVMVFDIVGKSRPVPFHAFWPWLDWVIFFVQVNSLCYGTITRMGRNDTWLTNKFLYNLCVRVTYCLLFCAYVWLCVVLFVYYLWYHKKCIFFVLFSGWLSVYTRSQRKALSTLLTILQNKIWRGKMYSFIW